MTVYQKRLNRPRQRVHQGENTRYVIQPPVILVYNLRGDRGNAGGEINQNIVHVDCR